MLIIIIAIGILLFFVFNKIMDKLKKTSSAICMLGIEFTILGGIFYNVDDSTLILSLIGLILVLVGFVKDREL